MGRSSKQARLDRHGMRDVPDSDRGMSRDDDTDEFHYPRLREMSVSFSRGLSRLRRFPPFAFFGERVKVIKGRLQFGLSSGLRLRRNKPQEGAGDIPPPSLDDSADGVVENYIFEIDQLELLLNDSGFFTPNPWPDSTNELECSVLEAAVEGRWDVIEQAFHSPGKKDVVLCVRNKFDWTPVHFAAYHGHLDVLKKLVSICKFPQDLPTKHHWTPAFAAAWAGHVEVVKYLLVELYCSTAVKDVDGRSLLTACVRSGNLALVKWFTAKFNAGPTVTKDGSNLLIPAAESGSIAVFDWVVSRYKLVPSWSENGIEHPLHSAAMYGHLPLTQHLVQHYSCDVYCKPKKERTLLHCAAAGGSVELFEWLMANHTFDAGAKTQYGHTPLMLAAAYGHLPVARLLVETYHCDVNEEDGNSVTPMMYATLFGHLPVLKMLVEHGGDVFHKGPDSSTALHIAAYGGSLECVEYLLPLFEERKFEVDGDGCTCLHYAVWGGSLPVMRYLVDQCGFDFSLRSADGHDCFLFACLMGQQGIVRELLTKDKVDRNVVDKGGGGAVHLACSEGHVQLVKTLVEEFGMSPDVRDNDGRTPIQLAPDSARADLLKVLHLEEDSSAPQSLLVTLPSYTAHESVLEEACWIPSGIESLFITPFGGVFPLQPEGGEEEGDKAVIQLHVPEGAVRADGEGVLEVRYAVIADGPFRTPDGYTLCSFIVYLHYNPAQTTKPLHLHLPHWSAAPHSPVFVTAPHTLPAGKQCYEFRVLEGGEFGDGYGVLVVDGHCTLFAEANRLEDAGLYRASQWEREEGDILHSKVAVTFDSNVWIRILKSHWTGWRKRFTESFEMKEDHIESRLNEDSGRGWSASVVGKNWVGTPNIEYKKRYEGDETELQFAVEEHMYPPAISLEVLRSKVPEHLQSHKRILLHVHGAKEGVMKFPIDFFVEKEVPSVVAVKVPSESGSITHQAPTTTGEREVVQSTEVVVIGRDPLSQPVHSCERYAVLFRKYVSRNAFGKGRAILEWVGLAPEVIDQCYGATGTDEEAAVQKGLLKWRAAQGDRCTWQVLLGAMEFAGIAQQHCTELLEDLQMMQGNK